MTKTTRTKGSWLKGVTYFASGSNHAGEIAGFAALGHAVGITADKLNEAALVATEATNGSVPVFVDSGAFGEVSFGDNGPVVVKPISDAQWKTRLALYSRLADALGSALTVVAPDKVGFADETLGRLSRYRKQVQAIAAKGATTLVPLQGADKVDFWRKAQLALNMTENDGLVPALPCKKNATSIDDVVAFCAATQPRRVHLLGLGAPNKNARRVVEGIRQMSPDTEISLDSCLITASVGKTNGRANHAEEFRGCSRVLTAATKSIDPAMKLATTERKRRAIIQAFVSQAIWSPHPGQPLVRGFSVTMRRAEPLPARTAEEKDRSAAWKDQMSQWRAARSTAPTTPQQLTLAL